MADSPTNLLGIGLPLPPEIDPNGDLLDKESAKASAQNYFLQIIALNPMEDPEEKVLAELKAKLEERKYAVVSIGFGLRGNRDLTEIFEKMVNLAREIQPAAKLAFATLPDGVFEACTRVLG